MAIEKTVSELAEILGVSRQAINNRVKALPPEDTEKNEKGVTVVTRSGLIKVAGIGAVLYTRRRKSSRMSERSE